MNTFLVNFQFFSVQGHILFSSVANVMGGSCCMTCSERTLIPLPIRRASGTSHWRLVGLPPKTSNVRAAGLIVLAGSDCVLSSIEHADAHCKPDPTSEVASWRPTMQPRPGFPYLGVMERGWNVGSDPCAANGRRERRDLLGHIRVWTGGFADGSLKGCHPDGNEHLRGAVGCREEHLRGAEAFLRPSYINRCHVFDRYQQLRPA